MNKDQELLTALKKSYDELPDGKMVKVGIFFEGDISTYWRFVTKTAYAGMHPMTIFWQKAKSEIHPGMGIPVMPVVKDIIFDTKSLSGSPEKPAEIQTPVELAKTTQGPESGEPRGVGAPTKYKGQETIDDAEEYLESCVDTNELVQVTAGEAPKPKAKKKAKKKGKKVKEGDDDALDDMVGEEDMDEDEGNGPQKLYSRFEVVSNVKVPTIEGLALHLKVRTQTLYEWEKTYPEFSDIMGTVRQKQADRLISGGLSGKYNPTIAKVLLTKHGYREGIEQSGKDGDDLFKGVTETEKKEIFDILFPNGRPKNNS